MDDYRRKFEAVPIGLRLARPCKSGVGTIPMDSEHCYPDKGGVEQASHAWVLAQAPPIGGAVTPGISWDPV